MKNLETDRLLLQHPKISDSERLLSFYEQNKEHFEPYEPKRSLGFYTNSYQKSNIIAEIAKERTNHFLRFYLYMKSNPDTIIGSVSISDMKSNPFYSCVLGYKLDHQYCHNGYAYEAITEILRYLIKDYKMHRIEAYIMEENESSRQLILKLGFQYDGICTDYAFMDGVWVNHERYTFLALEE